MIRRKRKRNPIKDDKKLMRKVAELLAKTIEKEPDGIIAYLLAAELIRRDSLYCEECHSYDTKEGCDWSICYSEIDELLEDSTLDMAKEAAEELAEDLGIADYVKVFRYGIQIKKYKTFDYDYKYTPDIDLSGADLSGADLSMADLSGASLPKANLYKTKLTGANLRRTNLIESDLSQADLYLGKLLEANLKRSNLRGTNLSEADLEKADFTDAKIGPTTIFKNAKNINNAIGLKLTNPVKTNIKFKKFKMTR